MAGSNGTNSGETEVSPELLRARRAADRINNQIALGHTIEFRSVFVNMNFPVRKAFVLDGSLFIDAGPYGEIAVAPEHYHFFSGMDLRDLAKRDHCD
jgi:hypothetical protein